MNQSLALSLCNMQGKLFALSGRKGYDSARFMETFMRSEIAADLDKEFSHMQWAGEAYIMSRFKEECGEKIPSVEEIFDEETLYWAGYLYRYWQIHLGESSKQIYKQAPASTMRVVYWSYHTLSPELAVSRLKETYAQKHLKPRTDIPISFKA